MNNEILLLLAGYFFFGALLIAFNNDVDNWKRISLMELPYNGWLYMIDCIAVDVCLVIYALTQWGGV